MRREAGFAGLGVFLTLLGFVLEPAAAQGLPEYHPNNPVVESRSGIYFQPFVEPRAGWRLAVGLDYASMTRTRLRLLDRHFVSARCRELPVQPGHREGSRAL